MTTNKSIPKSSKTKQKSPVESTRTAPPSVVIDFNSQGNGRLKNKMKVLQLIYNSFIITFKLVKDFLRHCQTAFFILLAFYREITHKHNVKTINATRFGKKQLEA